MDRIKRIEAALAIVADLSADMDNTYESCPGCGHKKYRNWTEHGLKDLLKGARTRLDRVKLTLENGQFIDEDEAS